MDVNDIKMIDAVIQREGGFVDNPLDRGGPTKYGITLATLLRYMNGATVEDVKALTVSMAQKIYYEVYLIKPGIVKIANPAIREAVFDAAVNEGPVRAIKHLQAAVGTKQDGMLGPKTLEALNNKFPLPALMAIFASRLRHYTAIASADPRQMAFLKGWVNRIAELMEKFA